LTPITESPTDGTPRGSESSGAQAVLDAETSSTAKPKKWKEREIVVALYADRQEVLAVDEYIVDDWMEYDRQ
jgi:hypothetical protein